MKVVLHDRTDGLGQEVREHAERKLARLARHFGKVADADVDFSEERKRSGLATIVCRINVHFDGRRMPVLSAHERGADALSALDLALDKIDRQVVKYKEKITRRKKPLSPNRIGAPVGPEEPRSPEPERVRMKLRPMTISEAVSELEADSQPFHVFLDEDSGTIQIVARRADGSVAVIEPIVP
ncbi:MAG TPA: ribosome-associated translation inhibitor RaiA [Candidatus Dormibacteraeota bacterium]|nr:ribosome-associated translation inhibitor RaiA [Candidatus Dormibacteraeota bacterium]